MAYSKAVVSIPNVSGNIVISVTTSSNVQNLFDSSNSVYNSRIGASGDIKTAGSCPGALVTNPISVNNSQSALTISGVTEVYNSTAGYYLKVFLYNSSDALITQITYDTAPGYTYDLAAAFTNHPTLSFIRLTIGLNASSSISQSDTADLVITAS